jgi:hypothetical protein
MSEVEALDDAIATIARIRNELEAIAKTPRSESLSHMRRSLRLMRLRDIAAEEVERFKRMRAALNQPSLIG